MATNIAVTDNKALLSGNGLSAPRSVFWAQCFVLGEVEITKSVSVCTSAEQEISQAPAKTGTTSRRYFRLGLAAAAHGSAYQRSLAGPGTDS